MPFTSLALPNDYPTIYVQEERGPGIDMTTYRLSGPGVNGTFTIDKQPFLHTSETVLIQSGKFLNWETSSLAPHELLQIRGRTVDFAGFTNRRDPFPLDMPLTGLDRSFQPTELPADVEAYAHVVINTVVTHWHHKEQAAQANLARHTLIKPVPGRPSAPQTPKKRRP